MEQYIPKSVELDEIDKLIDKGKYHEEYDCAYRDGNNAALYALKGRIDAIKLKEVDLKKEIDDFMAKEWEGIEEKDGPFYSMIKNDLTDVAKHFFELGLFSQLTWKDIKLISEIGEEFMNSEESDDLWKDEEVYYTTILNKLKEKGRDYKTERQIARELEQKGEEV